MFMKGLAEVLKESNTIEVVSFEKDNSVYDASTERFSELKFALSACPTAEWKLRSSEFITNFFDEKHLTFQSNIVTISNCSIHFNHLQDIVDRLKSCFKSINHAVAHEAEEKHIKEKQFNNAIDNLKF